MLDLMRQSAVPANIMRSAAKGALSLPAVEMLEILVFLAESPVFGEQAKLTLAGWDEASAAEVLASEATPREVLDYFLAPHNRRPNLLPALLKNPQFSDDELAGLARAQSPEVLAALVANERVRRSPELLRVIRQNPSLDLAGAAVVDELLAPFGEPEEQPSDPEMDPAAFIQELTSHEEHGEGSDDEKRERLSIIQKLARMTVGERVQAAFKGSKDERLVLIRDPSKVVASAVLDSPKLTDQEVEVFAGMKNIQEAIIRVIAGKRKFVKNYGVVKALVNNPRCPLDISLALMKHLLNPDLKAVSKNKNLSEGLQKAAFRLHTERTTQQKQ